MPYLILIILNIKINYYYYYSHPIFCYHYREHQCHHQHNHHRTFKIMVTNMDPSFFLKIKVKHLLPIFGVPMRIILFVMKEIL